MRTLDQIYAYADGKMKLPTLYTYDSKGKARMWEVETDGDTITVTHGLVDGKKQSKTTKAKPKNVGRANATTAEEQAQLEAKAKWLKQIEREDYAEDIEASGKQLRPMLAHDFHKVPHRVRWDNVCSQPKLDGLRLTAGYRWVDRDCQFEMMTRKGEVHNVDHLIDSAADLHLKANWYFQQMGYGENRCQAVDGEVYLHGLTLQDISSRAKRYQEGLTEELEYHVFDLFAPGIPFEVRYDVLCKAFGDMFLSTTQGDLVLVPVDHISNQEDLVEVHARYVKAGYEGAILRHRDGQYKIGRSADLFKYKDWKDEECLILEVWEDQNGNAMFRCRRKPTLEFGANVELDVTPKRTHDERKQMLQEPEKWVGKWITVRYQEVTPYGSLLYPRGMALRECDDLGEPIV